MRVGPTTPIAPIRLPPRTAPRSRLPHAGDRVLTPIVTLRPRWPPRGAAGGSRTHVRGPRGSGEGSPPPVRGLVGQVRGPADHDVLLGHGVMSTSRPRPPAKRLRDIARARAAWRRPARPSVSRRPGPRARVRRRRLRVQLVRAVDHTLSTRPRSNTTSSMAGTRRSSSARHDLPSTDRGRRRPRTGSAGTAGRRAPQDVHDRPSSRRRSRRSPVGRVAQAPPGAGCRRRAGSRVGRHPAGRGVGLGQVAHSSRAASSLRMVAETPSPRRRWSRSRRPRRSGRTPGRGARIALLVRASCVRPFLALSPEC